MAQTVAGAVLPVRPQPPHPGVSGGPAPSGRQPVSPQPKPEVLSLADHPRASGRSLSGRRRCRLGQLVGFNPKGLLGAVASVRGLGRQCRRPLAAGGTGGHRRIPHGPGRAGRRSCNGAAGGVRSVPRVTSGSQQRPVLRTGISGSKGLFSRCHEVVGVGGLFLLNPSPVGFLQHGISDVEGALGKILRILDEAFRHAGDKPVHGFCCIVVTEFFPG